MSIVSYVTVDSNLMLKGVNVTENLMKNNRQNESSLDNRTSVFYIVFKRSFDFLSSFVASVILICPLLILAAIIMMKDFGNPFYFQKRVGKNGEIINIVKLRSMKRGADHLEDMLTQEQIREYKREYKLGDDPRLLGYKNPGDGGKCFGGFLRKTSLDELPQIFWNICIKGNMSVVGPRPILLEELERNYIPEQQKMLLSVKPGLTGYWQAYARNNATYETGERQTMELYYVQNQSLLFDLRIIMITVLAVIKRRGAR